MHEGGGRWVGSNEVVELKKKKNQHQFHGLKSCFRTYCIKKKKMERRQKNDILEIGPVLEIAEANGWVMGIYYSPSTFGHV